jgi:cytochrome c
MNKMLTIAVVAAALTISGVTFAAEMPAEAKKGGCVACHAIDKKVVGPAWQDVAKKYKGDAKAREMLIDKVKKGGKGNWTAITGGAPMPPYSPRVKDEDIAKLIDFVLAL